MNENAKLNWGILGAARVNERLLPAIVEAANGRLVAIASRRPGAAAETLAKYAPGQSGVTCYDQLDALLANDQVQAVYLPLANHEHAEWAVKAIEAGKYVLCEKPMALKVAEIEAIEAAAKKHNVSVTEGFMYRFHPQHARVREIINSGLIGEVKTVRTCFSFMMKPARMYRLALDVNRGGGAMWDIGCYAIHTARMWIEKDPVAVTALANYVQSGADTAMSGVIDYGDGRYAHFDFSFERARRAEYEIIGTLGGIKCHNVWQLPGDVPVISYWTESGLQTEERLPAHNHFRLEIEGVSQRILEGKQPLLSLNDAKSNCRVIQAAIKSAEEGRLVRVI